MSLLELFKEHDGRGCGKWSHYLDIYEKHLNKFVGKEFLLFEIGVCRGGSLQIWKKFFGDKCKIVGFDIDKYALYQEDQIVVEFGDATNYEFMSEMIKKYGHPDVVIDDGSHIQSDVMASFAFLYPQLNSNGVYVIEDTHCAYRQNFGGGITSPMNITTILGRTVHDPSFQFIEEPYTPTLMAVSGISFYNSMIVIEKGDGEDVTPLFTGDEKDKNVQSTKEHKISQMTPTGVQEIQQSPRENASYTSQGYPSYSQQQPQRESYQEPPRVRVQEQEDSNNLTNDPKITPESIKYNRSVPYTPQSPYDQRPPSDLSEDEESLFKWNV